MLRGKPVDPFATSILFGLAMLPAAAVAWASTPQATVHSGVQTFTVGALGTKAFSPNLAGAILGS